MGEFLGSTGRQVIAMEPVIDNDLGRLEFGAASIGEEPGPSGGGVLFTFSFTAVAVGESGIEIDGSVLTDPAAEPIDHEVRHGRVVVGECMFGDFDCNCIIDIVDVMQVVGRWGTEEGDPDYDEQYDLDDDGDIDIVDVQIETSLWGRRCDDPATDPITPLARGAGANADGKSDALELEAGASLELSVAPTSAEVGDTVVVAVDVVDAVDLAGFDLWLTYDAGKLAFISAELGEFLAESGRSVFPLGPTVEDGRVGYGAFTMPGAPAPEGSGRVAELTFEVVGAGKCALAIAEATTVDSRQQSSPASGSSTLFEGRVEGGEADLFVPIATQP